MQFHVTCSNCQRTFTITSDGGERMRCTCPYCSQSLVVNMPSIVQPIQGSSEKKANSNRGNGLKILLTILIVILLSAIAIFGYIEWNKHQDSILQQEQAARKAHADSLVKIREQQAAEAVQAKKIEAQQRQISKFLISFYEKAVLTDDDPMYYARYLTAYCREMIFGGYPNNTDVDRWTLWWGTFGGSFSQPDYDLLKTNLRVTPGQNGWYNVRLSQDGLTEIRQVKLLTKDGHILIDDVR